MSPMHLLPIISGLISLTVEFVYGRTISAWIADKLKSSDAVRNRFAIGISLLEVILIGGCIEAADLSEMFGGKIEWKTDVALAFLWPCIVAFVTSQRAMWFHDTAWRIENEKLENQLKESQETTNAFASLIEADNSARQTRRDNIERTIAKHGERKSNPPLPLPAVLQTMSINQEVVSYPSIVSGALQPLLRAIVVPAVQVNNTRPAIRVTLFQRTKDRLVPVVRYADNKTIVGKDDLASMKSLREKPDAFRLEKMKQCLVVAATLETEPLIVSDTIEADLDETCPFNFTYPEQRKSARSIVCMPLRKDPQAEMATLVLAIDSNVPGLFSLDRKGTYGILCATLNHRLQHAVIVEDMFKCLSAWVDTLKSEGESGDLNP